MKVYRITPDKQCNSHIENSLESAVGSIEQWLEDSDKGTIVTVEIMDMTEKDYSLLPEYEGP